MDMIYNLNIKTGESFFMFENQLYFKTLRDGKFIMSEINRLEDYHNKNFDVIGKFQNQT
tara:strand:- start:196 stop:372 length:177 start_codon:yes stop_codon:yes gene_type:complete